MKVSITVEEAIKARLISQEDLKPMLDRNKIFANSKVITGAELAAADKRRRRRLRNLKNERAQMEKRNGRS